MCGGRRKTGNGRFVETKLGHYPVKEPVCCVNMWSGGWE